jgi:hypothetical protein
VPHDSIVPILNRKNPLYPIAIVALLSLALDAYSFLIEHQFSVIAVLRTVLFAAFLLFYVARSRQAWLASLLLFVVVTPAFLLIQYFTSLASPPSALLVLVFAGVCGLGIAYLIRIRQRYYEYLDVAT